MWRKGSDSELRCSFCNKSKDVVGNLISSPSDRPRAYICAECVDVCNSIIKDSSETTAAIAAAGDRPREQGFDPMLIPVLLDAIECWTHNEARGDDASQEIDKVRRIAAVMFNTANRET